MSDPRYHSVAAIVPFLVAASVLGVARISPARRPLAAAGALACCLVLTAAIGPWGRALGVVPLGANPVVAPDRASALSEAVALVPPEAPVTASNTAAGHLSARRYVYSVPVLGRAQWVVVDRADPWVVSEGSPILTSHPERVAAFEGRLASSPFWRAVFERDGVLVYRRVG